MTEGPRTRLAGEPTPAALRTRIVAGILYAAGRFVPVPLVDDLVREQVVRWLVRSTLPASLPRESTRVLYADAGGCLGGALRALFMIPIKLLLFPIRKVLAVVLGLRWASRDVAEMILLGRVLDHALAEGLLGDGRTPDELAREARDLRTAFDVAMKATDSRFLVALLGTALTPVRGLVAPAMGALRALRRSSEEAPAPETTQPLEPSIGRIQRALENPEVRRFVDEFDRRVMENLAVLRERRSS